MTARQRRKIFPHLEDSKTGTSDANGTTDDANDASNNNGKDSSSKNKNEGSYDNDKSNKSKGRSNDSGQSSTDESNTSNNNNNNNNNASSATMKHLLPLPLVLTVLVCSGLFWIASFRDVFATGKPMLDTLGVLWGQEDADANLLQYTKSAQWFDDSKGWKSKQGGLSAILPVTTDANNMGGLFLRKMAGAAGLAFHTTKLWPIVFHSPMTLDRQTGKWVGASWGAGHFDPLLFVGIIGDVCVSMFYLARLDEIQVAGAQGLGRAFVFASLVEALVFGLYLIGRRMSASSLKKSSGGEKVNVTTSAGGSYDPQEDPNAIPSRIVTRTVLIVSTLISMVSLRDLLFPGTILSFLPRDDIYLEWTGAFLHSPPPDTVEAEEQGLESPLYAGDKFVAQLLGMYLSLGCFFKFSSALAWSKGSRTMGDRIENADRSGVVSSKMIWKVQAFGNMLLLVVLRLFTPAASSASLDLRWHLMLVAYEMFIFFLYGFW